MLLAFGPEAKHKAWLVFDGTTLYVDRYGTGDLDQPECRVAGELNQFESCHFAAGSLNLGDQRYGDLRLVMSPAKHVRGTGVDETPLFKDFLAAQPEGNLFTVSVEVPFENPLPDLRDGSPIKRTRHTAGQYDATGILQFAARPDDASVIYFGGNWAFAPDGPQKLVRGCNEDLTLKLGTPGHGPGTFAFIGYDNLIPNSARPNVRIEYPAMAGNKPLVQSYVLDDRCFHVQFQGPVRVPDEVAFGKAQVTVSLEGWPEGRVAASTHRLLVAARKPVPDVPVSPEQRQVWSADGYSVHELRYTPDGKTLVVVTTKGDRGKGLYRFRLWDVATGRERCKCFQIETEPLKTVWTPFLAISADSKHLAIYYNQRRYDKDGKEDHHQESGQLHVFDVQTGHQLWHHHGEGWAIQSAAFSPDGQSLVTGHLVLKTTGAGREQRQDYLGEVRFWDVAGGKMTATLPGGAYQVLLAVEYSPDGKYVVFHDEHRGKESQHYLGVWDLSAQKLALKVPGPNWGAVFSPDGRQLATSSSTWTGQGKTYRRAVKVWELQTGQEAASQALPTGEGWLNGLTWSADGKNLFTSSGVGQLWRWDPAGVEPLVQRETIAADPPSKQPARDVWSWAVHRDSALYAFAVNGKLPDRMDRRNRADDSDEVPPPEIVLWNLKTMQRGATLTGHRGPISQIAFSPDGRTLVSGDMEGTVRFWKTAAVSGR